MGLYPLLFCIVDVAKVLGCLNDYLLGCIDIAVRNLLFHPQLFNRLGELAIASNRRFANTMLLSQTLGCFQVITVITWFATDLKKPFTT